MKKWWIITGAFVVVVVVAVIFFGLSNLGPLIKSAVNTYGPGITKTQVHLGDVGISIFSGEAKLTDFLLGNPKGFTSPDAMKIGTIFVKVDKGSLTSGTVILDRVEILRPDLTYERAVGADNLQTIMHNVQAAVGSETSSKPASKTTGGGKKLLIRDLLIKDGTVNLTMPALAGKAVSAGLPEIHLKDLGSSTGGAPPAEIVHEVFAALYGKITSPAMTAAFNKELKGLGVSAEVLGKEASHLAGAVGGEAAKGATSLGGTTAGKLKGLFGQ